MSFNMLGGLLPIKPREAARDVLAGLTLASMNIPQVLGYNVDENAEARERA